MKLVGTPIYDDTVAEEFCDVFEQAVPTNDAAYMDWLLKIIEKHRIDLLLPGIEADMYKWVEHIPEIEKHGAKVMLNDTALIALCKDKWVFYESLKKINSSLAIESSLAADFGTLLKQFGLPFLIKPRRGFGSKGIVRVDDEATYLKHTETVGTVLMAQESVCSKTKSLRLRLFAMAWEVFTAA